MATKGREELTLDERQEVHRRTHNDQISVTYVPSGEAGEVVISPKDNVLARAGYAPMAIAIHCGVLMQDSCPGWPRNIQLGQTPVKGMGIARVRHEANMPPSVGILWVQAHKGGDRVITFSFNDYGYRTGESILKRTAAIAYGRDREAIERNMRTWAPWDISGIPTSEPPMQLGLDLDT